MPDNLAQKFHALFAGMERAHGAYSNIALDHGRTDGKRKGDAVTKREPVTDALWQQHLDGTSYGIGIIPIRDDSTCVFGAIDVDVYADLDISRVAATVVKQGLPLIVCRSKSGGCHLYAFSRCPVPAADMQARLQEIAARLGFGTAEVFPKQARMGGDRDLGSWINAPYHNAAETNRYAVKPSGDAMTAEEFLAAAEAAKQPGDWFAQPLARNTDAPGVPDGPPCLQHLMALGFPPGTWNLGVFNLGVYCRKARPDDWEQHLAQLNAINFPPDKWPVSDLKPVIKSLQRKDYGYQCKDSTLAQYCDRNTCKRRKHGIGGENSLPVLTSLSKLCTDPPTWYLDIDGHRLELSTEELLNPLAFQTKCCNHSIVVRVVGRAQWTEHIRPYVVKANEIPVADDGVNTDDGSARGQFLELFERFCVGRAQGHQMEEVLIGKPFTEGGRTYFRLFGLLSHLNRIGFKFKDNAVVAQLKALGANNQQERIGGKPTRVWSVPAFTRDDTPLDVVPMTRNPEGF